MATHFNFRNMQATDALKEHIEGKIAKFKKYVSYPMEIHVFLSVEKENHTAEIKCHAEHKEMVATAESDDLYGSIDAVVHKIETQLKKNERKRKGTKQPIKFLVKQAINSLQILKPNFLMLRKNIEYELKKTL